jgi:hypothetical protein
MKAPSKTKMANLSLQIANTARVLTSFISSTLAPTAFFTTAYTLLFCITTDWRNTPRILNNIINTNEHTLEIIMDNPTILSGLMTKVASGGPTCIQAQTACSPFCNCYVAALYPICLMVCVFLYKAVTPGVWDFASWPNPVAAIMRAFERKPRIAQDEESQV